MPDRGEDRKDSEGELFRLLVENVRDYAIFVMDGAGHVLSWNPGAERLLGYREEEVLGQSTDRFFTPEDLAENVPQRERTAAVRVGRGSDDRWHVRKDGSRFWASGMTTALRDESGEVRGFAKIMRDLTDMKRAEQERRIYETALSNTPDFNFVFDLDGRLVFANKSLLVLWGHTLDEVVGKNLYEINYPHDLAQHLHKQIRDVIQNQRPVKDEAPYASTYGDRQYEYIFVPVIGADGSVEAVVGSSRDITEHKVAEQRLRESEQRYRHLADAMPQIVWTAQPDGSVDYLNDRWRELTGMSGVEVNDAWREITHPDDAATANARWAASLASGEPFEMELRLLDVAQQSYRWYLVRTVPDFNESGRIVRWFGTSTDIDAQKRAQESSRYLAEASAALAGVVDYKSTLQKVANLAVPYFADWAAVDITDDDGSLHRLAVAHQDSEKISLVHRLMREYPPDQNADSGAFAVLRTSKPLMVESITDDLLVQSAKDDRHLQLIRSLGLRSYICVPLVVSGKPLGVLTFATAESGRRYDESALALAVDISQRAAVAIENTQLYGALQEADRRKDEFLATLAHELRNPLAPIRNSLQILKMPQVDSETIERSRDVMERQVHHLVRLVDDLLDVSRVMRGKIELRRELCDLTIVMARAVETVQPLIDSQRHILTVETPTKPINLDADPVRIAQVIGNLLTNSAKYTNPGGQIWLTAASDGELVELRVRDTGIGIEKEMLPSIFELFVQADHASTKAQGGLGIGLTLVKNLVEMHDGSIEAYSEGLGAGTEVVVRLPLCISADTRRPNNDAKGSRTSAESSGHRVLVVDDNRDAANSLALLLRIQGHEVEVAYSGPAALAMTDNYCPDLILLDIGMPEMDGHEVARRIRQKPGMANVVLAALTGWGQQEDRRRTADAGFDRHLVKPPEPKALQDLLAGLKRRGEASN